MTAKTGDIVRITEGAAEILATRPDLDLAVGDEVRVVHTLGDEAAFSTFAKIMGAPEGAIWVETDNPHSDDGSFGLAPGEYELAA